MTKICILGLLSLQLNTSRGNWSPHVPMEAANSDLLYYVNGIDKKRKSKPHSCRTKEPPENSRKTALLISFLLTSFLH